MSENRHAIIVGGAGGIGSAIGRRLAADGYRITVADVNLSAAKNVLTSLDGEGHDAIAIDVTKDESVDGALDVIEARAPARVLVIASGGMISQPGTSTIMTTTTADWNSSMALNLGGTFFCIRKFGQQRLAHPVEQARIIVIGSGAGQLPEPPTEVAYAASKAGIMGVVRQAAVDLAHASLTVNTIAPGPIATEAMMRHTPAAMRAILAAPSVLKRLGTPEDVSAGVAFLASPESAYITGTTLDINGGIHMH